jgi:hypothetical protein
MKNFLLKIIFVGLTLGLVPQTTVAMNESYSATSFSGKKTEENYSRKLIYLGLGILGLLSSRPLLSTGFTDLRMLIWQMTLPPTMPTTTYATTLEIKDCLYEGNHPFHIFFNSKKYGEVIPVSRELQDLSDMSNLTILQLSSQQQDGPTCAKYAFSNVLAIEQLHNNKKKITSENIAKEIERPLKAIGFPGLVKWNSLERMLPLHHLEFKNVIMNYAQTFFPNNNIQLYITYGEEGIFEIRKKRISWESDIDKTIDCIIQDLNSHGISHIMFLCSQHATAVSIIKNRDNNYSIIYMDSNNIAITPSHNWLYWNRCYTNFMNFISKLKDTVEQAPKIK